MPKHKYKVGDRIDFFSYRPIESDSKPYYTRTYFHDAGEITRIAMLGYLVGDQLVLHNQVCESSKKAKKIALEIQNKYELSIELIRRALREKKIGTKEGEPNEVYEEKEEV
jgi:hypothetical protein